MRPKSISFTLFNTRRGHFGFADVTFRPDNAPSKYMVILNKVLAFEVCTFGNIDKDDILVYREITEEHPNLLTMVIMKPKKENFHKLFP